MDIVLRDKVLILAKQVRDWVQEKADRSNYNPCDLTGWCAIAAAELHRRLKKANIDSEIRLHSEFPCHAFNVVDDYIVDVTATQFHEFKNEQIVILHSKEAEAHKFYCSDKEFNSTTMLRLHQKKARWPKEQIAFAR